MAYLTEMAIFARVVEAESFSEAARRLGVSKSTVSKQVRRLEDHLGARLLDRTTRRMRLTEVGTVFYEHATRMLAEAEAAERAVTHLETAPRGMLRVTAPMTLGRILVAEVAADFARRYPEVRVDLELSDRRADLLEEGFDLAIRVGRLSSSSLVARKLATTRARVCATPGYLARRGTPARPEDLQDHDCLLYRYGPTGDAWRFVEDGRERLVRVTGRFRANTGESIGAACRAGLGIAVLPDFIAGRSIATGELTPILEAFEGDPEGVWALYPARRHLSLKVRAFIDELAERLEPQPPWLGGP